MKKIISILLAVLLVASCTVMAVSAYSVTDPDIYTCDEAIEEFEYIYETEVETKTYYFLMPNGSNGEKGDNDTLESFGKFAPSWYNQDATEAGIYWWESGIADPTAWAGYRTSGMVEDAADIYYANVPAGVTMIIWNNGVDGGMDTTLPIYYSAAQSINIGAEFYDPGESDNYPDGTTTFDGMIYVIDPDNVSISEFSQKQTCGGEWYYYYGAGCYGFTAEGEQGTDCLRDDHFDEAGNHVGEKGAEPDILLGDADQDGVVSVMDATEIQLVKALMKSWVNDTAELAADFDGDGVASVMDATAIQMSLAGLL